MVRAAKSVLKGTGDGNYSHSNPRMKAKTTGSTIPEFEGLILSDRDRVAFFEALIHPPKPNARLRRALRTAERRILA